MASLSQMTLARERIDAPSRLGMQDGLLYGLLPVLATLAVSTRELPSILGGNLVNPDTYMRLLRLEEGLRHHAAGYIVARDGSGTGTLVHWSHLLDSLLLLLAAPFELAMDTHAALHVAAAIFGPLCMGVLGVALCWAIAPLADRRWLWLTPLVASLSAAITPYGLPGEAHHHVLLLAIVVMTSGYALRGALNLERPGNGLAMGAWAAAGIWLTPESMPFVLMAFGGLWLAWLLSPRAALRRMIGETALGFAIVVTTAFALDPPYAGYASIEIDRISLVYVGLAIAVAVMTCTLSFIDRMHRLRVITGVAVPGLCFACWLACFPNVIRGPSGLLPARETHALLDIIVEMMPVRTPGEAIQFLLTGTIAALALIWFSVVHRSLLLAYAAFCAAILVVLGAMHVRFSAYAAALAAAMLPILIARSTACLAEWPESARALVRVGIIVAFILLPHGITFAPAKAADAHGPAPDCSLANAASLLAGHDGQVVLASPDASPELLYRTRVLTVGSLYHRNVAAFMRLRAAWRSGPSETLPAAVQATHASLVLFCPPPTRSRSPLVSDAPPGTLLDRLDQGHIPPWLHLLTEDPHSGNVLYEVTP